MYFKRMFPRISKSKFKEGVLVGPQIRELIQDVKLEDQLSEVEKAAWKSFKNVTTNFLKNRKAEDDRDMAAHLVQSYTTTGCNMSLKVRFLDSHLYFIPENLAGQRVVSTECDFTRVFPTRYQGKLSPSMVWMITANI